MPDDSGSPDGDDSNDAERLLSGKKEEAVEANAARKESKTDALSEIAEKSGGKETESGDTPSADGESIPSSVDPDASSTAEGSDE